MRCLYMFSLVYIIHEKRLFCFLLGLPSKWASLSWLYDCVLISNSYKPLRFLYESSSPPLQQALELYSCIHSMEFPWSIDWKLNFEVQQVWLCIWTCYFLSCMILVKVFYLPRWASVSSNVNECNSTFTSISKIIKWYMACEVFSTVPAS